MNQYSVALCTYNGQKFIGEQLQSILEQSVKPEEIIISDDGSKDNTLLIADNLLKTSGIKYRIVANQNTKGVTGNFSYAISLCSCDIIFTSDQDDIWMRNKAETILNIFSSNRKAKLVFSDGYLVDQSLNKLNCNIWTSISLTTKMIEKGDWFSYLLNRCLVTGAAMAFRRELFSKEEEIPDCWLHDGWLAWKAVVQDGLVACPEKLILYRQHGGNVVGMKSKNIISRASSYFNHFNNSNGGRNIRYCRYIELKKYMWNFMTKNQQVELDKCIRFWSEMIELNNEESKIVHLLIVMKNWFNGSFRKYASGNRGAFRAFVVTLFAK